MSKRFTFLLAGLAAISAVQPATVAAQSVRLDASQQIVHKLRTGKDFGNIKVASKSLPDEARPAKAPRHATTRTFDTPYLEEFNTQEAFDNYTVIDANNDGDTWEWNYAMKVARYHWNSTNAADDWLISPGINLEAGKTYLVTYMARANSAAFQERIEAKWGSGNTVADLTNELTPSADLTKDDWVTFRKEITPAANGAYNFGFHAISDPNKFVIHLDSISIVQVGRSTAPDSVTNLVGTADPSGALKVTLTFNAPTKTLDGTGLSAIDSIIVRKDGATISSLKQVTPGAALTVVDNNASNGENKYTITAVNENGDGRAATISVYAGIDVPSTPQVTAHDNLSSVKFTWPDVTGANGGLIIPSQVSYEVWNTQIQNGQLYLGDSITTVTGVNEYSLDENTGEGEQQLKYWGFNAKNSAGASTYTIASLVVGAPYTIPFSNSFAGGTLENQFVGATGTSNSPSWSLATDESYDNDGGSAVFYNTMTTGYGYTFKYVGQASLYTGKISLAGAENPKLIFSYNGSVSTNARLVAELQHYDGTIDSLWSERFTGGAGTWKTAIIDLPSSLANEPYVIIRFHGVANTDSEQLIYVDDIHVADPYQNDAAVSVTAPAGIYKGQNADIVATVSNQGIDQLSGLEVKISVNDEIVKDTTISTPLALYDHIDIPVAYKTSSTKDISSLSVKAEVVDASDLDDSNNTATANINLAQAEHNKPTGLQGTENNDSVNLSWTSPETKTSIVTDDFESYTPWLISEVGQWTFVNGDGGLLGSISQNHVEPNYGSEAAYEVWRPGDYYETGSAVDAHSGEQCLASIYKLDQTGQEFINSDDWIISPELSGNAQTISFWVNNLEGDGFGTETFQVLTSTTDKQISSFNRIGSDYTQSDGTWRQISSSIPQGSKYFAIRRISSGDDAFLFLVDDITYENGESVSSYNIYVDGELVGSTTSTTFDGKNDGAAHTYSVTAVFEDGSESEPATIDLVANSIDDIHAQLKADKYDVYTIGGAQVKIGAKSLNGLTPGVYVINGKKVILK